MAIYIVVYNETDGVRLDRQYIDILCSMYNYRIVYIDRSGTMREDNPLVFQNLQEVWDDSKFAGYTFVYFDSSATKYLHEYTHPVDNVAYVIGSDFDGYTGDKPMNELNGELLKLKSVFGDTSGNQIHAAGVVAAIVNHRYYQENGL